VVKIYQELFRLLIDALKRNFGMQMGVQGHIVLDNFFQKHDYHLSNLNYLNHFDLQN